MGLHEGSLVNYFEVSDYVQESKKKLCTLTLRKLLRWLQECETDLSNQDRDSESNIIIGNSISSDHEIASELSDCEDNLARNQRKYYSN